ncbi:MAG TPA: cyclic nucleotide-binding domain-containing protein [Gaiellales bacterium]|jgi:CRP-like cAMP-binding protein|nr:cyclic nucleotide-binding domain-containing protein [Gaiellales bacterium]
MPDEPYEFLRGVPLFSDVSDKDLHTIAVSMRRRVFVPGEGIVAEGEGGIGFFFVEKGSVAITQTGERRATLGPGDHFGEIALLSGAERTATVSADSDVVCWGMPAWNFRPLVREQPSVTMKLLEGMARQLAGAPRRGG